MAIVTNDEQDETHLYYRIDDYNVRDGGKLLVRPRGGRGGLSPVQTNYLGAGATGRVKCALDSVDGPSHVPSRAHLVARWRVVSLVISRIRSSQVRFRRL